MLTIFPNPGSFNDFCARNPEITNHAERLHHTGIELSIWRATSPDIDMSKATLGPGEEVLRQKIEAVRAIGGEVAVLLEWPKVGEYEVPEELRSAVNV